MGSTAWNGCRCAGRGVNLLRSHLKAVMTLQYVEKLVLLMMHVERGSKPWGSLFNGKEVESVRGRARELDGHMRPQRVHLLAVFGRSCDGCKRVHSSILYGCPA